MDVHEYELPDEEWNGKTDERKTHVPGLLSFQSTRRPQSRLGSLAFVCFLLVARALLCQPFSGYAMGRGASGGVFHNCVSRAFACRQSGRRT